MWHEDIFNQKIETYFEFTDEPTKAGRPGASAQFLDVCGAVVPIYNYPTISYNYLLPM